MPAASNRKPRSSRPGTPTPVTAGRFGGLAREPVFPPAWAFLPVPVFPVVGLPPVLPVPVLPEPLLPVPVLPPDRARQVLGVVNVCAHCVTPDRVNPGFAMAVTVIVDPLAARYRPAGVAAPSTSYVTPVLVGMV